MVSIGLLKWINTGLEMRKGGKLLIPANKSSFH